MVDNRSAGFFGIAGAFNFKSGDASGMANAMSDDKMGQGGEYFAQDKPGKQRFNKNEFVDRSAQLKGSLDSLAVINSASVTHVKKDMERKKEEDEKTRKKKNKKTLEHLTDNYERN